MSCFTWDRNITFSVEIKEYFLEGTCDAFDDSIIDMLSHVASHYKSYIEKRRSGELRKLP